MRMCAQLRVLHSKMHGFFGDRSDKVAGVNRKKLLHLIDFMINTGERRMADYITANLSKFAKKADLVAEGVLSLDQLRKDLANPLQMLTRARKALMAGELQARDALLASS